MAEIHITSPVSRTHESVSRQHRSIVAFGLWLRTAIAGAGAALAGLVGGWSGALSLAASLALLVAGVAIAVFAARRVRAWLAHAESAAPVVTPVARDATDKSRDAELAPFGVAFD